MGRLFSLLLVCGALSAGEATYEIRGQLTPAMAASVALHGSTFPFQAATMAGPDGKFRFKSIPAGAYTVIVFRPGRGEQRSTVDIGPSQADKKSVVKLSMQIRDSQITPDRSSVVSMRALSVPDGAKKQYAEALKFLGRNDVPAAIARLEKAVEIAPQFIEAWNHLGTIAYQTKRFDDAEKYFRRALEIDPQSYSPLVNLGGVLVTLQRFEESFNYNQLAVLMRPHEALANSQLGMAYMGLNRLDQAEKYLLEARRLDPAHFSHPQLLLAEIALRKGDRLKSAAWLEDFLQHHPDWPTAPAIREAISRLRSSPGI
jgi:Tfp pilus assembly protein PilF